MAEHGRRSTMDARRKTVFALAAVAGLALASPAPAADLPRAAPVYKAAPAAVPPSWTGCYGGGTIGWIGTQTRQTLTPDGLFIPFLNDPSAIAAFTTRYRFDESGVTGGVQAGCNRQWGSVVAGIEADFNATSIDHAFSTSYALITAPNGQTFNPHTDTISQRLAWFSTVRGRLGWAADRLLLFATGGLAVGHLKSAYTLTNPGGLVFQGSEATTRLGWTVGGGLEYALSPAWTAKVEYLYLDFGETSYLAVLPAAAPNYEWKNDVETRAHVARIGVNYRFGGF
jgi:outer membrane immunogenic protein